MTIREIAPTEVGLPVFKVETKDQGAAFELSSHARAREALDLALSIQNGGFNVFVVGEDRSGRMTATLSFLRDRILREAPPEDWVYLCNFRRPHRPKPYALPRGRGRALRDAVTAAIGLCRDSVGDAFADDGYQESVQSLSSVVEDEIGRSLARLREQARRAGLELLQTDTGLQLVAARDSGTLVHVATAIDQGVPPRPDRATLQAELEALGRYASRLQLQLAERVRDMNRGLGEAVVAEHIDRVAAEFQAHEAIVRWLSFLKCDLVDSVDLLRNAAQGDEAARDAIDRRYAVNLFVDHADAAAPEVVLEPNPTLERLFGRIEYRQVAGSLTTDHTLIRAGALHRANGGVLVLRAEAVARDAEVWDGLKAALRDRVIRVPPARRSEWVAVTGAPDPKSVPLRLKVVVVGSPHWYYSFFAVDPEFQTYFKVKADIAPDMRADRDNVATYAAIIQSMAQGLCGARCSDRAVELLLGFSARRAEHRRKLSARFELVADILTEATFHARTEGGEIAAGGVLAAFDARRRRNARLEDRTHEDIVDRLLLIDTQGVAVGQVNALTVRDLGDHAFGLPARVTARASAGRSGLVNIERDVALGGPIQQKAVMVLQGFLAGHFARTRPLSFNCSLTFEQSYGGVEGDSASLAELLAVLSDLSGVPLRQDVAVTGSVNQLGRVQAVGGLSHKIEGFFRTCAKAGPLTGSQGVVIPMVNAINVALLPEVAEAVAVGRFHLWTVETVEDALELMSGFPAGSPGADGSYPVGTVYHAVGRQLDTFNTIMERWRSVTALSML